MAEKKEWRPGCTCTDCVDRTADEARAKLELHYMRHHAAIAVVYPECKFREDLQWALQTWTKKGEVERCGTITGRIDRFVIWQDVRAHYRQHHARVDPPLSPDWLAAFIQTHMGEDKEVAVVRARGADVKALITDLSKQPKPAPTTPVTLDPSGTKRMPAITAADGAKPLGEEKELRIQAEKRIPDFDSLLPHEKEPKIREMVARIRRERADAVREMRQ